MKKQILINVPIELDFRIRLTARKSNKSITQTLVDLLEKHTVVPNENEYSEYHKKIHEMLEKNNIRF